MKAVIMAGGKGTRLRPLTSHTPKPMVPLLNRPCMEYIVELLKKHGITEIAVTIQYLPEVIKSYFGDGSRFGVHIEYFEENVPLGTAGSVKNCEEFLDERFIVISGDALTDFDLTKAIQFHEQKEALATLVLTQVENPLEFGVVMTDAAGSITRFLEKPSWSEVFSDTVNTGIYILEPEIFGYMKPGVELDFSKDLFPFFLQNNKPMYGYAAEGYWSDIGSMEVYRQAQFDMLDGMVNVEIKAQEVAPRIFMEQGVRIDSSVRIEGPAYIGEKSHLQSGVAVGAYSIIGNSATICTGTKLSQAIMWENAYLAKKVEMNGSTLCRNVTVGESAIIGEGAVIGDHARLARKSHIKSNVKIYAHKAVEENATVTTSLIYGSSVAKNMFGYQGIKGVANVDITPEFVTRLASAYAYLLKPGARIALSACGHPFAQLLKHSMMTSLCSSGVDTVDFGVSIAPITRYGVRSFGCAGGIHLHMPEQTDEKMIVIEFFDHNGLPITRDYERKIENAYSQETYVRSITDNLGSLHVEHNVQQAYLQALLSLVDLNELRRHRFNVLVDCEQRFLPTFLAPLFAAMGVNVQFRGIADGIVRVGADAAIKIEKNGERFHLYTETGERLTAEKMLSMQLLTCFDHSVEHKVGLPVSAPAELETLARVLDIEVVRTKVTPRAMMEVAPDERFHPLFDAIHSFVMALAYMAKQDRTLSDIVASLPSFFMERKSVFCPWASKGKVMRKMMEEMKGKHLELVDGIKVYDPDGWVLILPDSEESHVSVISQGSCQQSASTLASAFARRISEFQQAQ
ncbi:sugar phosphate nucleotidyltransferase [Brevibacillus dissolubilis]|uniref:sugar phosphate nucleotidyltransferase n=1 Tax=Brevibacillus dissolubilis TaxID=1844116 RepID=UPI001116FFEB|nr:sugar phosphate nucleotidyltransferase [Brevibacillus dissolubilis]